MTAVAKVECQVERVMARAKEEVSRMMVERLEVEALGPEVVRQLGEQVVGRMQRLAGELMASWVRTLLEETDLEERAVSRAQETSPVRLWRRGRRPLVLTFSGGVTCRLSVLHVYASRPRGRGRLPKSVHRGRAGGHRAHPALQVLGFVARTSPTLAHHIGHMATSCDSFERARDLLSWPSSPFSRDVLWRRFDHVARLMHRAHMAWLLDPTLPSPVPDFDVDGQRIAIAFDGGRCRKRRSYRGRPRANGHRGFDSSWVEPRQLVLYFLDQDGKKDPSRRPISWATMGRADACMNRIRELLEAISIEKAHTIVVLGDGLHWQWTRLRGILNDLVPDQSKIREIVDLPHALGKLRETSEIPSSWSQKERDAWYKARSCELKKGQIRFLALKIRELAVGGRAKKIIKKAKYFEHHEERMRYKKFREEGLPTSSGVVESMIRQVINLRIKSCGKFWTLERLERMLLLRSALCAGRFGDLFQYSLDSRVAWWRTASTSEHAAPETPCIPCKLAA